MKKIMDHVAYPKKLKKFEWGALWFTAKDAMEAAQAYPEGENAGYYLDEVNYCLDEIARRNRYEVKVKDHNDTVHVLYSGLANVGPVMREVFPLGRIVASRPFDKAAATEAICAR